MEAEMTTRFALPALAALLLAYAAPSAIAESKTPSAKAPEIQFVQVAKTVTFKDGVLTLGDASPMTIFFSDRPAAADRPAAQRSVREAVERGQERIQG
jgi:hypothetical protein